LFLSSSAARLHGGGGSGGGDGDPSEGALDTWRSRGLSGVADSYSAPSSEGAGGSGAWPSASSLRGSRSGLEIPAGTEGDEEAEGVEARGDLGEDDALAMGVVRLVIGAVSGCKGAMQKGWHAKWEGHAADRLYAVRCVIV
jgi:hypothetical protein